MKLSKKITTLLVTISLLVTIVTMIFEIVSIKNEEHQKFKNDLDLIKKSFSSSISAALWSMDTKQLEVQLNAIINLNGITKVEVWDLNSQISSSEKEFPKIHEAIYSEDLFYEFKDQKIKIGTLKTYVNLNFIQEKVYSALWGIFVIQALKIAVVAIVIYIFVGHLITGPMSSLFSQLDILKDLNALHRIKIKKRRSWFPILNRDDEFTRLEIFLNDLHEDAFRNYQKLNDLNINLENLVESKTKVIIEQREMVEQSAKLSSLGELAAGVAHEVNNPLSVIKGKIHTLRRRVDEVNREKDLEIIERNIDRIAQIVKSLKIISRDSKNDPLDWVLFKELVEEALVFSSDKIKYQNIELRLGDNFDQFAIQCRASEFIQVLINLIYNGIDAVEFSEEKWIEIKLHEEGNYAVIKFTDSGKGIAPEIQDKIFDPFFTTKQVGKGTGLGLSISAKLIKNSGGQLEYDPTAPHTTFKITIPMVKTC